MNRESETQRPTLNREAEARRPTLEVKNVSKFFGHVTALSDVSLELYPGTITALCGDNGAGKSTLVSVMTGLLQPDLGEIYLNGEQVKLSNPHSAQEQGIRTVFQDLAMAPQRDVAENVFAGRELRRGIFLDRRRMVRETANLIADMKVNLPSPRTKVLDLSGGQRQAAAIVRTLLGESSVILLDEPTAALGVRESGRVLELVRRLKDADKAVCMITHNMEQVFDVCDIVAVLRLGRMRAIHNVDEITRDQIVGLLTGAVTEVPVPDEEAL